MNSEVTLESIAQAYEAREKAYQEYERTHQFQDLQNFEAVRAAISPYLYDSELEAFRRECQVESGLWLEEEDNFKKWSDPNLPTPDAENCSLNLSNDPKAPLRASATFPEGAPPPPAFMTCQKKLWFHAPPPLLRVFAENFEMLPKNSFSVADEIFSAAIASVTFLM